MAITRPTPYDCNMCAECFVKYIIQICDFQLLLFFKHNINVQIKRCICILVQCIPYLGLSRGMNLDLAFSLSMNMGLGLHLSMNMGLCLSMNMGLGLSLSKNLG